MYERPHVLLQIIAVCDFLNYLRYVERGLVKSSGKFRKVCME